MKTVTIKIDPETEAKRDKLYEAKKCIGCERDLVIKENGRPQRTRGVCPSCEGIYRRRIADSEVTEQELMDSGLYLSGGKGGRPSDNPVLQKLKDMAG